MKYVNWYNYMKDPLYIGSTFVTSDVSRDCLIWQDIITGNHFYLKPSDRKNIVDKASEYIITFLTNKDFAALNDYLSGRRKDELSYEQGLFPQLPFDIADGKNPRLMDFFSIRAGLLYALEAGDKNMLRNISYLTAVKDYVNEKARLQIEDTLKNMQYDKNIPEKLKLIDMVLSDKKIPEDDEEEFEKLNFDMVKGGAVKVKQYYLETNKIKDIRGASMLLDDINRRRIPDYIKNRFIPESIIYAGGGNIFIIAPAGTGKETAEEIEKIYEMVTVTAQCAASYLSCISLKDISLGHYKSSIGRLQDRINERQMSKVDFRTGDLNGDINYGSDSEHRYNDKPEEYRDSERLCTSCNIRLSKYKLKNGEHDEFLCTSCCHKIIVGGKEGRRSFKNEFIKFAGNHGKKIMKASVDNLGDIRIKGNESIGVIYGDGNNMGAVVQNIENLLQMKYFSEKTEDAVTGAVYGAIMEEMDEDRFEIIAIGGDDIFIIVPGQKAVNISKKIGKKFDELFRNHSEGCYTITMSLGVVIAKYNKPVQYLFDLSKQLLKKAKKKSKKVNTGTLDIMALETDSAFASNVNFIRKKLIESGKAKNKICTLKPYTWSELDEITEAVKLLKNSSLRGKAYNLMEATLNMDIDEGNLYFGYQRVRSGVKEMNTADEVNNTFSRRYNTSPKLMYLMDNAGGFYSPWPDIVELWDYVEAGEEHE